MSERVTETIHLDKPAECFDSPFDIWWNENYRDVPTGRADRTFAEEVWKAATKVAWVYVFNVVSNMDYTTDKELIMQLEAARDDDGSGPAYK